MSASAPNAKAAPLLDRITAERPATSWFAPLFFLAFSVAFNIDKLVLGAGARLRFHDTFEADFPRIVNLARDLKAYGLVDWYPHALGGMPANAFHFTQLHPLVLLATEVPPWALYHGLVLTYGTLAGYGFYRFVRTYFELDHFHALLGGILFVLVSAFHFSGIVFIPFLFLFPLFFWLLHGEGRRTALQLAGSGLALAVVALFSYPVNTLAKFTILHAVVLGAVFLLRRRIDGSMLAAAVVFWGGLTILFLPTFFPLIEYAEIANRTYDALSYDKAAGALASLSFDLLVMFVARLFTHLSHVQALLIASVILMVYSRKATLAGGVYLLMAILVGVFYSELYHLVSGNLLGQMDLYYVKWAYPFCASLVIILAISDVPASARKGKILFVLIVIVISSIFLIKYKDFPFARQQYAIGLLIAAFVLLAAAARRAEAWRDGLLLPPPAASATLAVAALVIVMIWGQQLRREYTDFDKELGPDPVLTALLRQHEQAPFRVTVIDWHPTRAQLAGLETFGGASPIFSGRFRDYALRAAAPQMTDPKIKEVASRYWYHVLMSGWDLGGRAYAFNPESQTAESWNLRLLAAANVRYMLSAREIPGLSPAPGMPVDTAAGPGVRVYEIPEAFPRAYLAARYRAVSSADALLDDLAKASMADLRSNIWVNDAPPVVATAGQGDCGSVEIESYTPDRIRLAVAARSPCYLVMLNNYDDRWKATINGVETPVFRANHAFQAVTIAAPGNHAVEFRYRDHHFPLIYLLLPLGALVIGFAPWAGGLAWRGARASKVRSEP